MKQLAVTPTRRPAARYRTHVAAIAGVVMAMMLGGCGGDDDVSSTTTEDPSVVQSRDKPTASIQTADPVEQVQVSIVEVTTAPPNTDDTKKNNKNKNKFVGFDGEVSLQLNPEWTESQDTGTEYADYVWGQTSPNRSGPLTVVLSRAPAQGSSYEDFVQVVAADLEQSGAKLGDSGTITGANGQELRYFDAESTTGNGELMYNRLFVVIENDNFYLLTIGALKTDFEQYYAENASFVETLQVTAN